MKVQTAFCSACDRDVQIALPDEPAWEGHANIHDTEIVCLEIGDKCTGAMCPVGAQPPAVMAVRLIQSGYKPVIQPVIEGKCDACDQQVAFAAVNASYVMCTLCGTTVDRSRVATETRQ